MNKLSGLRSPRYYGSAAVLLAILLNPLRGSLPAAEPKAEGAKPSTVSATGTVEPAEVVDVGAEVAGRIESFGADPRGKTDPRYRGKPIDYGSPVEEGTVLAQIDAALYVVRVEEAKANCLRTEAELDQAKARLELAEDQWQRARKGAATAAASDLDSARINSKVARAGMAVAEAGLAQSRAALKAAEINLGYTTIKSPIKGLIIDRRVNIGQTVVGSLNAPSLFLIAKDAEKLQVWASVKEADIAKIHQGQAAQFTVDAFPREVFHGKVEQIRLNATMVRNVVTYTVVVTTDNPGGKLLPYLTANVQFEAAPRGDAQYPQPK
jgi:HlyD family secretion protein